MAQPPDPKPPVILFLPGLGTSEANTGARIAELMAAEATRGEGSFTVKAIDGQPPSPYLLDGRHIMRTGEDTPLADVYTVEYRRKLDLITDDASIGRRARLAVTYMVNAAALLFGALKRNRHAVLPQKRATARVVKLQLSLAFGFAAVFLLTVAALGAVWILFSATGLFDNAPTSLDAALKIGWTGLAMLVGAKLKSLADRITPFIRQMIDYTQNERHASGTRIPLREALDTLLEGGADRQIHLVAYSFGSLVAFDFFHPPKSQTKMDQRYLTSIKSLVTMGCPIDVVQLYTTDYLKKQRVPLIPGLKWVNIFVPTDIFGSDLSDDTIPEVSVKSEQYTHTKLSLFTALRREGYASHNNYFGATDEDSCIHIVMQETWMPSQPTTVVAT